MPLPGKSRNSSLHIDIARDLKRIPVVAFQTSIAATLVNRRHSADLRRFLTEIHGAEHALLVFIAYLS